MIETLFELMGTMFFLMVIGAILRAAKIIDDNGKKCLTDVILYAILPCNIIKAFSTKMESGMVSIFITIVVIALIAQIMALLIAKFFYLKMNPGEKAVYQYATVCSNSGFLGNPIAEGVFGSTGLLYASIFLIPMRIVMWSAGVSYFTDHTDKKSAYKKLLTHPCMIATYIGFVIMLTGFNIPEVINGPIRAMSNCTTAMTMMYVGTILVGVDFRKVITLKQIHFSLIRLIGMPLVVYVGCFIFKINPLITGVSVLMTGMPAGSTTSLLAAKYHADEDSAAKCVVLTTVLSIVTIPLWSVLLLRGI